MTVTPGRLGRATVTTMTGTMTAIGAATQNTTVTIVRTQNTIRGRREDESVTIQVDVDSIAPRDDLPTARARFSHSRKDDGLTAIARFDPANLKLRRGGKEASFTPPVSGPGIDDNP